MKKNEGTQSLWCYIVRFCWPSNNVNIIYCFVNILLKSIVIQSTGIISDIGTPTFEFELNVYQVRNIFDIIYSYSTERKVLQEGVSDYTGVGRIFGRGWRLTTFQKAKTGGLSKLPKYQFVAEHVASTKNTFIYGDYAKCIDIQRKDNDKWLRGRRSWRLSDIRT